MSDQATTQLSTIGVPAPRQADSDATSSDSVSVPGAAQRLVLTGNEIEFQGADGAILGKQTLTGSSVQLELSPAAATGTSEALSNLVNEAQAALVHNVSAALKSSMRRIGSAFNVHLAMSIAVFVVGLGSFVIAAWKAIDSPGSSDVAISGVFGGMSAVAFITYFVRMPLEDVASAGPEMAWLLGIVNTYWTKLVYMNDQETFVAEIQKAQVEFEKSMCLLLKTSDYLERNASASEAAAKTDQASGNQPAAAEPASPEPAAETATAPQGGTP